MDSATCATGCCHDSIPGVSGTIPCALCEGIFHLVCLGLREWRQSAVGGAYVCRSCLLDVVKARARLKTMEALVARLPHTASVLSFTLLDHESTRASEKRSVVQNNPSDTSMCSSDRPPIRAEFDLPFEDDAGTSPVPKNVARKSCWNSSSRAPRRRSRSSSCNSCCSSSDQSDDSSDSLLPPERKCSGELRDRAPSECSSEESPDRYRNCSNNDVATVSSERRCVARKSCKRADDRAPRRHFTRVRCKLCRVRLRGRYSLRRHIFRVHGPVDKPGESSHHCAECSLSFNSEVRLWRHTWLNHIGAQQEKSGLCQETGSEIECPGQPVASNLPSLVDESRAVSNVTENNATDIAGDGCETRTGETEVVPLDRSTETSVSDSSMSRSMSTTNGHHKHHDDDNYLYCGECKKEHLGDCPLHGPMNLIRDSEVTEDDPLKADHSVPDIFRISRSQLPGAGMGVFTTVDLQHHTVMGPYKGRKVATNSQEALTSEYVWEIRRQRRTVHCIDGKDLAHSNWIRYVNCANDYSQQNLTAFQYRGEIFYRTIRPVAKGTELLVWYGSAYGKVLGLVPERRKRKASLGDGAPKKRKLVNDCVQCKYCGLRCSSNGSLRVHVFAKHNGVRNDENGGPLLREKENAAGAHDPVNIGRPERSEEPSVGEICRLDRTDFFESSTRTRKRRTHSHSKPLVHTAEEPRPYNCYDCGTAYKQLSHLTEHNFHCHGISVVHRCRECWHRFDFFRDMLDHQRKLRHKGRDKIFVKSDVDVQVTSVSADANGGAVDRLLTRAERLSPHLCIYCQGRFKTIFSLRQHQLKAHGIKVIYRCKECETDFPQSFLLLRAHRIESGHHGTIRRLVNPAGDPLKPCAPGVSTEISDSDKRANNSEAEISVTSPRASGGRGIEIGSVEESCASSPCVENSDSRILVRKSVNEESATGPPVPPSTNEM